MNPLKNRDDISKFVVHLTKDYTNLSAEDNLINILKSQTLEARNYHCLFNDQIRNSELEKDQKSIFKSVCFTETPLVNIKHLTDERIDRKVKLRPYGLAFWRDELLKKNASPAIYINGVSSGLDKTLRDEFVSHLQNISKLKRESAKLDKLNKISKYYSLINTINNRYDFSWEREWRHIGNFSFNYNYIAAIIAPDPDSLRVKLQDKLSDEQIKLLNKTIIIAPEWSYEDVIHQYSLHLWNNEDS
ncbi:abortive infection system antitoxin AbiGi family protein [uncultured Tolumonas sp.]|uniref:abortive infection system antitoxin AbiGi family protein n=1 Tax=uncultured Tolumonas sp. TaxID=263765 RepID=UPI00292DA4DA|nr:abortive infection system antitoxin AbiGi family protein [uncultured Tolumonas sp.]